MVLLAGDIYCYNQVIFSSKYSLISMLHGKLSCLLIVNDDRHLIRELEYRIFTGHGEGAFWLLNYLELHKMILRAQESAIEVRHEDTSALQN